MIFVLTGGIHCGKTTMVIRVAEALRKEGYSLAGIVSQVFSKDGVNLGYDTVDLQSAEKFPLLRKKENLGDFGADRDAGAMERVGDYYFSMHGLRKASQAILNNKQADLTVIDEIGPLEIKKKMGLWAALKGLFAKKEIDALFVVRDTLLDEFLSFIKGREKEIFSIKEENIFENLLGQIQLSLSTKEK